VALTDAQKDNLSESEDVSLHYEFTEEIFHIFCDAINRLASEEYNLLLFYYNPGLTTKRKLKIINEKKISINDDKIQLMRKKIKFTNEEILDIYKLLSMDLPDGISPDKINPSHISKIRYKVEKKLTTIFIETYTQRMGTDINPNIVKEILNQVGVITSI